MFIKYTEASGSRVEHSFLPGSLVCNALEFAIDSHRGQFREFSGLPYITHPIQVASALMAVRTDEESLAAALLHDVIEDCGVTKAELINRFGYLVAEYVSDLTNDKSVELRSLRKQQECIRLGAALPPVHDIKLCDMLSNSPDILAGRCRIKPSMWAQEALYRMPYLSKGNEGLRMEMCRRLEPFIKEYLP